MISPMALVIARVMLCAFLVMLLQPGFLRLEVGMVRPGNGQEAFEAVSSKTCDLVFMDWQMVVMDGYVATKAI